jgi:hypothetical protein
MRNPFFHSTECTELKSVSEICKDCSIVLSSTTAVVISEQGEMNESRENSNRRSNTVFFAHMSIFDTVHTDSTSTLSLWGKNQQIREGYEPLLNRFRHQHLNLLQITCPSSTSVFEVLNEKYRDIWVKHRESSTKNEHEFKNLLATNKWNRKEVLLKNLHNAYPAIYNQINKNTSEVDNNEDGKVNSVEEIQPKRAKTGEHKEVDNNEDRLDKHVEKIQAKRAKTGEHIRS